MKPSPRVVAVLLLALLPTLALPAFGCVNDAPAVGADRALSGQADTTFASLVQRLSEPGGYFDTDNLISNERSYLHVLDDLRDGGVEGGAYIGVGPDQNFSYIAAIRPEIAFIVDIRRDNLLQHLFFKAAFGLAADRIGYLALLFGNPEPGSDRRWATAGIEDLVEWIDTHPATPETGEKARRAVRTRVQTFGIPLSREDLAAIDYIHESFIRAGMGLRFTTHNRAPQPYYPTYRQLLLEGDRSGGRGNYLASEESFQVVKRLQDANLVVPVVGDLAGDHALGEIGRVIRERDTLVSAFYTSNVEFYLMRSGTFDRFARTVAGLPMDDRSMILRSYFHRFGGGHPATVPGYASTQIAQPMTAFAEDIAGGGYRSYTELVYASERVPDR